MRHRPALDLADPVGQAAGQRDAPGRDAQEHDLLGSPGPLDDLVRDPGQRAVDLRRFQDGFGMGLRAAIRRAAGRSGIGDAVTGGAGLTAGRVRGMCHEDLLSRLTGRAFKGRQFRPTVPAGRFAIADAAPVPRWVSGQAGQPRVAPPGRAAARYGM